MKRLTTLWILLILMGCGGGESGEDKSGEDNRETAPSPSIKEDKRVQIPTNISVDIPEIFLSNDKETREEFQKSNKQINRETENSTYALKFAEGITQTNIFLVNLFLEDMIEECKGYTLNTICNIPKDTLSYEFNQTTITRLSELSIDIDPQILRETILDKAVNLGKIEFIKHDDNSSYQYSLMLDISTINNTLEIDDAPSIVTFRWSKDNNLFYFSLYQEIEEEFDFYTEYNYINRPSLNKEVFIQGFAFHNEDLVDEHIYMTHKQYDNKDTLYRTEMRANQFQEVANQLRTTTHFENIKLTKEGGRNFYEEVESISNQINNKSREINIFDNNGTISTLFSCIFNKDGCDIYDVKTWNDYSNDSFSAFKNLLSDIIYLDLKIEGGKAFEDGIYYILSPEFKPNQLDPKTISELKIGSFMVFQNQRIGGLENLNYIKQLDKVQIVQLKDSTPSRAFFSQKGQKSFELIKKEEMPTLSLIESR